MKCTYEAIMKEMLTHPTETIFYHFGKDEINHGSAPKFDASTFQKMNLDFNSFNIFELLTPEFLEAQYNFPFGKIEKSEFINLSKEVYKKIEKFRLLFPNINYEESINEIAKVINDDKEIFDAFYNEISPDYGFVFHDIISLFGVLEKETSQEVYDEIYTLTKEIRNQNIENYIKAPILFLKNRKEVQHIDMYEYPGYSFTYLKNGKGVYGIKIYYQFKQKSSFIYLSDTPEYKNGYKSLHNVTDFSINIIFNDIANIKLSKDVKKFIQIKMTSFLSYQRILELTLIFSLIHLV